MSTKAALRAAARTRRDAIRDRDPKSRLILHRIMNLPAYLEAAVVSTYVGVGSEVSTLPLITSALETGKTVAVPWVDGTDIHLARITRLEELQPAGFGLLEPPAHLRTDFARVVAPSHCGLILVPGLAFDRRGHRLGYGRGYYDRLLSRVPRHTVRIGLAFEDQLLQRVPDEVHDQRLDMVVTERGTVVLD